jgi:hypothetical protein
VSTLLPLSRVAIALYLSACLAAIGACLGLHSIAAWLEPRLGKDAVAALRLEGPGTLGRWLASTLLGLAAATAAFTYSLRRHRLDDYHGRYRSWILAAAACVLASLAESTDLAALGRATVRLGTDRVSLRFDAVWPITIAILAGGVIVRLAIEIRRCGPALATLTLASLGFIASAAVHWQWPISVAESALPYWGRGTWLTGYLLVLATFFLYGRHVQLEVAGAGILPARPKRKKSEPAKDAAVEPAAKKPALKLRTDLDPVAATGSESARAAAPKAMPLASEMDSERSHLSRAERRKQRQERRLAS